MAVDTETKRRSALGMVIMALAIAPVPDGTIAAIDREHIIGIYAGIAPAAPGVSTTAIHILSISPIDPVHIADTGDNLLIHCDIEVQRDAWFGGATNYLNIIGGIAKHFGTSKFLNLTWDIETLTSDDTLDAENVTVLLDGSSNSVTASLPTAVGIIGRVYYIKSIDAANITDINPNGSETIDGGSANLSLAREASVTIISDNSNWQII